MGISSLDDIDYPLPEELIATQPAADRTDSRLMRLDRSRGEFSHHSFQEITGFLRQGDLLVFNNSRVIRARFLGSRKGQPAEMLLVERIDERSWKAMVRQSRKFAPGDLFVLPQTAVRVQEKIEDGMRRVEFERPVSFEDIDAWGYPPLPPYIIKRRQDLGMEAQQAGDGERYQSVMARHAGSVAAPTASLHFSNTLLDQLARQGVLHTELTLHIGPGTFKPVEGRLEDFQIHREWVEVPEQAVKEIRDCRARGGRVIAVGTTVVRSLESASLQGDLRPFQGYSNLFIRPPFPFQVTDALITNFHMPKSTLLLLVYAFAGRDLVRRAYEAAIREKYRFFSFGDAMFIE